MQPVFRLMVLVCLGFCLQGCHDAPRRTYYIMPGVWGEENRRAENANVFIHLTNESLGYLTFDFKIEQASAREEPWSNSYGSGAGLLEFGPHSVWTYGFALPSGRYVLKFSDRVGEEWVHPFEVSDGPVHLWGSYWLNPDEKVYQERAERLYRPTFQVRESDRKPAVF